MWHLYSTLTVMSLASIGSCVQYNFNFTNFQNHTAIKRDSVIQAFQGVAVLSQCAAQCLDTWNCNMFSFSNDGSCLLSASPNRETDTEYRNGSVVMLREDILSQDVWPICKPNSCRVGEACFSDRVEITCVCNDFSDDGRFCMRPGSVEAQWLEWTAWSSCTKSCSTGVQKRSRECNSGYVQDCLGNHEEVEQCQIQECPVWDNWSSWTICSSLTTCGAGHQTRDRTCMHDVIQPDGTSLCFGPARQIKFCETSSCHSPVVLIGDTFASGLLQIYNDDNSMWFGVCYNNFSTIEGNIACHQMGFGDVYSIESSFPQNISGLSNFSCDGDEHSIQSCQHSDWSLELPCDSGYVTVNCSVDGLWSLWAEWEQCKDWCGNSTQIRRRYCNFPPPLHGGADCLGDGVEERFCFLRHCPVDGEWQEWMHWSFCTEECGGGTHHRDRTCLMPQYGGQQCQGESSQVEDCNTNPCAVDGVWLEWADWSTCSLSCGGGTQTRHRNCTEVMYGGMGCVGENLQRQDCNEFYCPVDGVWLEWTDWTQCSASCAGGLSYRSRICEGPFYNGLDCVGNYSDQMECNTHHCPVPGEWNVWSSWSICNVTCGRGTQIRHRYCEPGLHGGANCTGADSDAQECNDFPCPINGVYEAWSDWSMCSKSCDGGIKWRNRTCDGPYHGGLECQGNSNGSTSCNSHHCPVDGEWMPWSFWGQCDVTCGGGIQSRNRTCDGPYFGGKDCDRAFNGSQTAYRECNNQSCPIDGEWSDWFQWNECSKSCGNGLRSRYRICDGPYYGGDDCTGDETATENCSTELCPNDGVWMEWSPWSFCNVTCGGGQQFSIRDCDGPYYGGADCQGPSIKWQNCGDTPCPVDGVWDIWSDWSTCDVTCAYGKQMRTRNCTGPFYGGLECVGADSELQECFAAECPVDGEWLDWKEWSQCNVTCGGGIQLRNRTCFGPFFRGQPCVGDDVSFKECGTQPCPIDGYWEEWGSWQECNVTCAGGIQTRTRVCHDPLYGGHNCTGADVDYMSCNDNPCPVDGQWSLWSSWSACNVSCAGGISTRYRICTLAAFGGSDCEGDDREILECNTHNCPVDGVFSPWSNWTACSVSCGGGDQTRERWCDGPYYGGSECQGPVNETRNCNKHRCPVDGVLSEWTSWSECPVSCGGASIFRYRNCTGPFYGGLDCVGDLNETMECNTHYCPVDGNYTQWTDWTPCNVTCGGGMKYRRRDCEGTAYGGKNCSHYGDPYEDRVCNDFDCPINGVLTEWTDWSDCTLTCGFGSQSRYRDCDGPYYGGLDCLGSLNDTRSCNDFHCPVDGYFTEWSNWTSCSVSCGTGKTQRYRDCVGPFYNGLNCSGDWTEDKLCNDFSCPVDGVWEEWTSWSECSVSCGGGIQHKYRNCTGPYFGGLPCNGSSTDSQDCNKHHCPIDGVWLEWTGWSNCSATCGGGTSIRSRDCDGPYYGGLNCSGDGSEVMECNTFHCPIPGNWTEWNEWTDCSQTCGAGARYRYRDCDTSWIEGLKAPCAGDSNQTEICNDYSCTTARTCSEWFDRGLRISGPTVIDPDGDAGFIQPFQVYCDMTINGGETILKHDSMNPIKVDGYESKCEFYQEVTYDTASVSDIVGLVDVSVECKQFVSWNCISATINHPLVYSYTLTYWLNRDYQDRYYIGDLGDYIDLYNPYLAVGCECSIDMSCGGPGSVDPTKLCNCDINDVTNRTDSGYIRFKPDLPITGFCAGDTGAEEEVGIALIGELRCCGTN